MPVPGVEINVLDTAAPAGVLSDTGVAYFIGQTPRGALGPTAIQSYGELLRRNGDRTASGVLHDAVESAFSTGLARGYVLRIVGDNALAATRALVGPTSGTSLTVTASSPGDWGDNLSVAVIDAGSSRVRIVVRENDEIVEQSPAAVNRDALLTWSANSARYVKLTPGANTALPAIAADADLTGGDDDADGITPASYIAALDRISAEYPTGQILAPGVSDEDVHLAILAKGADAKCQRFAPLDCDPTWTVGQIISHAQTLRDAGSGRWGTLVVPRVRVPAPGGGVRFVPASAIWAGRASYTDATEGVGQPPMGADYGESTYMLDVERTFTDDERNELNEAGVIVIARVSGRPRIYGARTLADSTDEPAYKWVNGSRAVMRYRALATPILENYVGRRVTGDRSILIDLSNDLNGMSERERIEGNLFGETPDEAFLVNTRYGSVNTDETIAEGYLNADAEIRVPPVAERVRLNLSVRAPGDRISSAS